MKQILLFINKNRIYFVVFLIVAAAFLFMPLYHTHDTGKVQGITTTLIRGSGETALEATDPGLLPDNPSVQAESYIVYSESTGKNLAERNIHTRLPIASLTKLVTLETALDYVSPTDVVVAEPSSLISIKPVTGVRAGSHVYVNDLVGAMIVGSTNDAAQLLADTIQKQTQTNFSDLMNTKAQSLGLYESHFANPQGFDAIDNYSTAADLVTLTKVNLSHGLFEALGRSTEYRFTTLEGQSVLIKATNKLIKNHIDLEAVKTGNTPEAKGGMVTRFTTKAGKYVIIVLGSPDRETDTLLLKDQVEGRIINN